MDFVYLPLYRISIRHSCSLSLEQALDVQMEINNILDKHYVYAYPQLHTLNEQLKNALANQRGYNEILRIMFHQISVDYELLKKVLGYPSENLISIFIRMTNPQKLEFALGYLNLFWLGLFIGSSVYLLQNEPAKHLSPFMLSIHVIMILLNVLHINQKKSKQKS